MRRAPRLVGTEPLVLRRRQSLSIWQSLAIRGLLVLALLGIALTGHWLDSDGLRDNADGHLSFTDLLYFTMITVTTVGYGDIVPVTDSARMFDTFVVTPIRLFVWVIFLGTTYTFVLRHIWDQWRTNMIKSGLTNHIVVCGFGGSGSATVAELLRKGVDPQRIVVIDPDERRVETAIACGVLALRGDATRNATLSAARVETARAVVVSPGRDDTTALIVLTARQLNRQVQISASVRDEDNEDLMQQAGANTVVNPSSFGGHLLAQAVEGHHAVDYLHDLATAGGRVFIRERMVAPEEVGRSLGELRTGLGLRIHRGTEVFGFWEAPARRLEPGDVVVEVVPVERKSA